jgi:nitrate/nitrite-specific signal transduction histidine kinase
LSITDDGGGLPDPLPKERGMGLRIMAHRSAMIGGHFTARRRENGGTLISCSISAPPEPDQTRHEQVTR